MSKNEMPTAPGKRGAPNRLGSDSVVHTTRLTKEVYQGVLRHKVSVEISTGKSISMSAAILELLSAAVKSADRRRTK